MKLTFRHSHQSIKSFPDTDLPMFTVITGVNGAGKTHLLQAISERAITVDVAPDPAVDVRLFDWNTLVPNNASTAGIEETYSDRDKILDLVQQARRKSLPELERLADKFGLRGACDGDVWGLLKMPADDLAPFAGERAEQAAKELQALGAVASGRVAENASGTFRELLVRIAPGSLIAIDQNDLDELPFGWNQTGDLFQQSFARMFLAYFEAKKINQLRRLDEMAGTPTPKALTDAEFVEKHGRPPWEFVNETFRNLQLDFEIDWPTSYTTTKFLPQLRKKSTGTVIRFHGLSSGERILMSFAFCLYYSLDRRQTVVRPKLLLFDEIDAPLHPSMSRMVVNSIADTLVAKEGVHVIMASHSPATVAVAADESVHVMRQDQPGVHPISKRQAIAILTSEIPTLSVDFSGRRQVLVESHTDARRYDRLYRCVAGQLQSTRSLTFIAVGRRDRGGNEQNAGCDQVRQMVSALADGGNATVLGLLDWDQSNDPVGRIHVLAHGERYAIENCLLDPLLLAAFVAREAPSVKQDVGLADSETFHDLREFQATRLQAIVDTVQRRVLGLDEGVDVPNPRTVQYAGGFSLQVSVDILEMQCHTLDDTVRDAFPALRRFKPDSNDLFLRVIDTVVAEFPQFVPRALLLTFEQLLEFDELE